MHKQAIWSLGLMSGTSLDGVDVALLHTDGVKLLAFGPHATYAYTTAQRRLLRHVLDMAHAWDRQQPPPADFAEAEALITQQHIDAVARFLHDHSSAPPQLIGFHGQTILHAPSDGLSLQLGDAQALAQATQTPVVADFRQADIAQGGQGAPLAPLYHAALAQHLQASYPVAILNLGGIANLTWLAGAPAGDKDIIAFDVGVGNALLDDWASQHMGVAYDDKGQLAARGQIAHGLLNRWLADDWFALSPPKSLDRLDLACPGLEQLSAADGAATLTAFSAGGVARAIAHLPKAPQQWVLCGGGQYNPVLCTAIQDAVAAPCTRAHMCGWPGAELEAQAFAYLGVRAAYDLPLSLPATTGVTHPLCGGRLYTP